MHDPFGVESTLTIRTVLRNKLAFTIAHLFLNVYPNTIPTFLHPFLNLLVPSNSSKSLNPSLLVVHLLIEIAQEIHDSVMRSARAFSQGRQQRDGIIRDVIRTSGDERIAVEGLLALANKGMEMCKGGDKQWLEVAQLALKALSTWIREFSCPYRTDSQPGSTSLSRSHPILSASTTRFFSSRRLHLCAPWLPTSSAS